MSSYFCVDLFVACLTVFVNCLVKVDVDCLVLCGPSCCLLLYWQMRCEFPGVHLSW